MSIVVMGGNGGQSSLAEARLLVKVFTSVSMWIKFYPKGYVQGISILWWSVIQRI